MLRILGTLFLLLSLTAYSLGQSAGPQPVTSQSGGDFSQNPNAAKVPEGVILVKGAVASASDAVTPLPEGGGITGNAYDNPYFHLSYPVAPDWMEKFKGPPPSDSGHYVLAQFRPSETFKGAAKGTILVSAQDMFFTPATAGNAMELVQYSKDRLSPEYKVERQPTEVKIANHAFARFDYIAPAAGLHWYVLATEIRCHMVEFIFTSRDVKLLDNLIQGMDKMKLPDEANVISGTGGGLSPVCIKDYATGENVIQQVDPVLTDHRFNPMPVRIIIDKTGKVKHIHLISAFPEQAKSISDALLQWKFKPYLRNGQPVEVETGIMFGMGQSQQGPPAKSTAKTAVSN